MGGEGDTCVQTGTWIGFLREGRGKGIALVGDVDKNFNSSMSVSLSAELLFLL